MKNILINLFCLALILFGLTSCSALGGPSKAYSLGVQAGEKYRTLKEGADLLGSYVPEGESDNAGASLSISKADIEKYCSGTWIIAGIANGLKNSNENRDDYAKGCLKGAGF